MSKKKQSMANPKMFITSVSNITIPLIIARRGKGHSDVACRCSAQTRGMIDPVEFVKFFTGQGKLTLAPDTLHMLAEAIREELKLNPFSLRMDFELSLDRISANFQPTFYSLPCFVFVSVEGRKVKSGMGIEIPVLIRDVVSLPGKLVFSVNEPKDVHFEDMLDHAQKYVDVCLYPLTTTDDREALRQKIGQGKTAYDLLTLLQDSCKDKSLGAGGEVSVYISDVYNIMQFQYKLDW